MSDPVTAPELVELAAAAMWNRRYPDDPWEDLGPDDCDREEYLDDARAVMDALAKAGTVEWGTVGDREGSVIYEWSSEESARYYAERHAGSRVVSRIPATPWTAVEG